MSTLPEAGIGDDAIALPWHARLKSFAAGKASYALADQVAYSFGNMVVLALLARNCSARDTGVYILTQRAMDVLIQLCNVFLWGPYVFNLPAMEKPRQRLYTGSVFLHQLISCLLGALVLGAAAHWSTTPTRSLYHGVFAPLVFTSIGILFREYTRRMYFADMRMKTAFWTDLATVALQIAGVAWLLHAHSLDVPNTLWMLALGAIVVSLYWLVTELRTFTLHLGVSAEDLRLNLRLGRWFLGSNMVFTISSQCNPWLLSWLLGGASVWAYAACEQVVNIPRVALVSMQNVMAPMMARAYAEGGKPSLKAMVLRMNSILFLGALAFAAAIAALGPWVTRTLFKKNLPLNGRTIMVLLSLNLVAYAATMAQSYGLTAIDRAQYTFYANLAGLAAQVAVSVWLVRAFQVPGAAAAMLVGSVLVLAVRQLYYSRQINLPQEALTA